MAKVVEVEEEGKRKKEIVVVGRASSELSNFSFSSGWMFLKRDG